MELKRDGDLIVASVDLGGGSLGFRAHNVRRTRTGTHARIDVLWGPHLMGYDTFNIERHGDRGRLANACGSKEAPKNVVRMYMDEFCAKVWPAWVEQYAPAPVTPSLDNLQPAQYLLNPYVWDGAGTILFAPPGQGKSYMALLIAQSINQGCAEIWPVSRQRVLYVNLERSAISLERRLLLVNQALGLSPETPMLMANARGKTLSHVVESIPRASFDVVVLDSLSRSGAGSMKEDDVANSIMDTVNDLAHSWLVLAHSPRGDATHVYGSQMFDGAADLVLSLRSARNAREELGVEIKGHKANDIPIPDRRFYALDFDQYGLAGFRTAMASEFPKLQEDGPEDRLEMIRDYLLAVGSGTVDEIAAEIGVDRSTVQREVKSAQFLHRRKDGKRFLYSVKG